jgi:hypothetical protein
LPIFQYKGSSDVMQWGDVLEVWHTLIASKKEHLPCETGARLEAI